MRNTKILRLAIISGLLLGVALSLILPRKVASEPKSKATEDIKVRIVRERPDIKTYALSKVGYEWEAFDYIISHESSWIPTAQNPTSTAFGLGQFLNFTWKTVGCIKTEDPYVQIDCTIKYMEQRYGSITKAQIFWEAHRWY